MALSGKKQKVKAILDGISRRLRKGEKFNSNHQFEVDIKPLGYGYKEAERLIVELGDGLVRDAYIKSFGGNLPSELKQYKI